MNKLEEIKNGLKCWDDHFPLNPPESKTEELLREEIKRRAQTFHAQGIENVRYLLSILEQAESALSDAYFKHGHVHSLEALQAIRGNVATEKRGGLLNPDGGDYPLKWMSQNRED